MLNVLAKRNQTHPTSGIMTLLIASLIPLGVLLLSVNTQGQQGIFLSKYRTQIQHYILTGYGEGWQRDCDILSGSTFLAETTPQISMDVDKVNAMNINSAFAFSHCVLVNYDVGDTADLQKLIKFGLEAINHVRIALVLNMGSGITLDMITNTTKLPFLIAGDLELGKEQFLCPVLGESVPRLDNAMCQPSYVSYETKTLRIALMGPPPEFILNRDKTIDGINIRLIEILRERLNFIEEIVIPRGPRPLINMVS